MKREVLIGLNTVICINFLSMNPYIQYLERGLIGYQYINKNITVFSWLFYAITIFTLTKIDKRYLQSGLLYISSFIIMAVLLNAVPTGILGILIGIIGILCQIGGEYFEDHSHAAYIKDKDEILASKLQKLAVYYAVGAGLIIFGYLISLYDLGIGMIPCVLANIIIIITYIMKVLTFNKVSKCLDK